MIRRGFPQWVVAFDPPAREGKVKENENARGKELTEEEKVQSHMRIAQVVKER